MARQIEALAKSRAEKRRAEAESKMRKAQEDTRRHVEAMAQEAELKLRAERETSIKGGEGKDGGGASARAQARPRGGEAGASSHFHQRRYRGRSKQLQLKIRLGLKAVPSRNVRCVLGGLEAMAPLVCAALGTCLNRAITAPEEWERRWPVPLQAFSRTRRDQMRCSCSPCRQDTNACYSRPLVLLPTGQKMRQRWWRRRLRRPRRRARRLSRKRAPYELSVEEAAKAGTAAEAAKWQGGS